MRAVEDRGRDACDDEADDDQYCAADASFVFGEAVGVEDLVEQGGEGVEGADVGGEGEEYDVEGWRAQHVA